MRPCPKHVTIRIDLVVKVDGKDMTGSSWQTLHGKRGCSEHLLLGNPFVQPDPVTWL